MGRSDYHILYNGQLLLSRYNWNIPEMYHVLVSMYDLEPLSISEYYISFIPRLRILEKCRPNQAAAV